MQGSQKRAKTFLVGKIIRGGGTRALYQDSYGTSLKGGRGRQSRRGKEGKRESCPGPKQKMQGYWPEKNLVTQWGRERETARGVVEGGSA